MNLFKSKNSPHQIGRLARTALVALAATACTGQIPGMFKNLQQTELFNSQLEFNSKIDLLFVVDNSTSMDVHQQKLRTGFGQFALKYLNPSWDIRVAVITSDAFIAHSDFTPYLNQNLGSNLPFLQLIGRTVPLDGMNGITWNQSNGRATVKLNQLWPKFDSNYAKLIAGYHDGPIPSLCVDYNKYFMFGVSKCTERNSRVNTGVEKCLNPGPGESSIDQCVNTVLNDTVRSGKAIISTKESYAGLTPNDQTNNLIRDFLVNVSVGTGGFQSERGLASLLQMIADNEAPGSASKFFRKDSLRGVIFVTDEDDQSFDMAALKANFFPGNPTPLVDPGNTGYSTVGCPPRNVDGHSYTLAKCVTRPDLLMTPTSIKANLDTFFDGLDEGTTVDVGRNYFISTITPMTGNSIHSLQNERDSGDDDTWNAIETYKLNHSATHQISGSHDFNILKGATAVERGDRYIALGNLVGNGSMALDLAEADFTPILTAIGNNIIEKKSTFFLRREPTGSEEMIVSVIKPDGTVEVIPDTIYVITGKILRVTDEDLILSLNGEAKISINYQPRFVED